MKARSKKRTTSKGADTMPVFLTTFRKLVRRGEWVTCSKMAKRMGCAGDVEVTKDVSRKLSNLSRFGHLERRKTCEQFEYRLPQRSTVFALQGWLQPVARSVR